jgi:hypothetical protein
MIELRGAQCAQCGRDTPRYLNFAHAQHDPAASDVIRVCAGCHARHDAAHRLAVMRRRRAARFGQLWLLPEIEWAAVPAWAIPRAALAAIYAQGVLF